MRELIISDYDSSCGFTAKILDDNKVERTIEDPEEMIEFGLYDVEWGLFSESSINTNNDRIKQFDRIIVCQDGDINIYNKD